MHACTRMNNTYGTHATKFPYNYSYLQGQRNVYFYGHTDFSTEQGGVVEYSKVEYFKVGTVVTK